jgi:hypothetical protein
MGKPSGSNIVARSQSPKEEIAKAFAAGGSKNMSALPPKADICGATSDVRFDSVRHPHDTFNRPFK